MWVHPDLIEHDKPWTTVSHRRSPSGSKGKGKANVFSSNVISIVDKESDSEVNKLTDSVGEAHVLATDPVVTTTRYG